jgi:hypothetical protein
MNAHIAISITYKPIDRPAWQTMHFTPETFFDLDPGERAEIDSVPRHSHAIDYIGAEPGEIQHTVLAITNVETGAGRRISETFWNGGKNRIIETHEKEKGVAGTSELIVETAVSDQPQVTEIVRASRQEGPWALAYHVFIRKNPDGTEMEEKVYPPQSA